MAVQQEYVHFSKKIRTKGEKLVKVMGGCSERRKKGICRSEKNIKDSFKRGGSTESNVI